MRIRNRGHGAMYHRHAGKFTGWQHAALDVYMCVHEARKKIARVVRQLVCRLNIGDNAVFNGNLGGVYAAVV